MSVVERLKAAESSALRLPALTGYAQQLVDVLTGDLDGDELYEALDKATSDLAGFLTELDDQPVKKPSTKPRPAGAVTSPASKRCPGCDATKPADQFGRHAKTKDGLQPRCRECKGKAQRKAPKASVTSLPVKGTAAVCPVHGTLTVAVLGKGRDVGMWLAVQQSGHHHSTRCDRPLRAEPVGEAA